MAGTGEEITVRGKITFRDGAPPSLPEPSVLKVTLNDVSRACAPSIQLGKYVVNVKGYSPGTPLSFTIKAPRPERTGPHWHGMQAVLNVGWEPSEGSDEWLRQGDYLNDTQHNIDLSGPTEFNMDVEVIHYKH